MTFEKSQHLKWCACKRLWMRNGDKRSKVTCSEMAGWRMKWQQIHAYEALWLSVHKTQQLQKSPCQCHFESERFANISVVCPLNNVSFYKLSSCIGEFSCLMFYPKKYTQYEHETPALWFVEAFIHTIWIKTLKSLFGFCVLRVSMGVGRPLLDRGCKRLQGHRLLQRHFIIHRPEGQSRNIDDQEKYPSAVCHVHSFWDVLWMCTKLVLNFLRSNVMMGTCAWFTQPSYWAPVTLNY